DRPGDRVPRLQAASLPDVAGPSPLRARRLARVHGDRAVLDRDRSVRRGGARALLYGLRQPRWTGARVMGAFDGEHVVVVGGGVAGSAAARVLLAEGATGRVSASRRATASAAT